MPDLDHDLRELIDGAAQPVTVEEVMHRSSVATSESVAHPDDRRMQPSPPDQGEPARPGRHRTLVALLGTAALVAVLAGGGLLWSSRRTSEVTTGPASTTEAPAGDASPAGTCRLAASCDPATVIGVSIAPTPEGYQPFPAYYPGPKPPPGQARVYASYQHESVTRPSPGGNAPLQITVAAIVASREDSDAFALQSTSSNWEQTTVGDRPVWVSGPSQMSDVGYVYARVSPTVSVYLTADGISRPALLAVAADVILTLPSSDTEALDSTTTTEPRDLSAYTRFAQSLDSEGHVSATVEPPGQSILIEPLPAGSTVALSAEDALAAAGPQTNSAGRPTVGLALVTTLQYGTNGADGFKPAVDHVPTWVVWYPHALRFPGPQPYGPNSTQPSVPAIDLPTVGQSIVLVDANTGLIPMMAGFG